MALKQRLQQKQLQRLSPQQIQLMKLLQIPTIALEQRIKEELEGNPALEEGDDIEEDEFADLDNEEEEEYDDGSEDEFSIEDYLTDDDTPDYALHANNSSADDEEKEVPLSGGQSFRDLLREHLGMRVLSELQKTIAETIIGNLDDDGYLRREIFAIVDDLAFTQNIQTNEDEVEDLLDVIQSFEPAGVGARNLQECLLIQLSKKEETENVKLATTLITKMMDEFSKKHYTKICQRLHIDEEKLKEVLDEVLKLNPRPGNSLSDSSRVIQNIVADFMIANEDGKLILTLNGRNAPELKVSNQYKQMLRTYSDAKGKANKEQKEAVQFVKQKLDGARWFIDAIKQRQMTLYGTMDAIMEYQKEYFLTGDETKLKPMILKDISEIVNLDISTISRVANSKYVQTQFGTFLLKSFFSESLTTESGEEVSSREVKKILSDAIEAEEKRHPLADEKLAGLLKEKGYTIARRTVAKYREQLGIPVARLRKEL